MSVPQAVMSKIDEINSLLHELPAYTDSSNALESYIMQRDDVMAVRLSLNPRRLPCFKAWNSSLFSRRRDCSITLPQIYRSAWRAEQPDVHCRSTALSGPGWPCPERTGRRSTPSRGSVRRTIRKRSSTNASTTSPLMVSNSEPVLLPRRLLRDEFRVNIVGNIMQGPAAP